MVPPLFHVYKLGCRQLSETLRHLLFTLKFKDLKIVDNITISAKIEMTSGLHSLARCRNF